MTEKAQRFSRLKALLIPRPKPVAVVSQGREVVTIEPKTAKTVTPSRRQTVVRPERAAWDDRGWRKREEHRKTIYEGFYQVTDRREEKRQFPGRIEQTRWRIIPYIANPPEQVRKHPKWACFSALRPPWFRIHWYRSPKNVDDCILYVERILDESINRR